MTETFFIPQNLEDEQRYQILIPQIKKILHKDDNIISNLSNFTAVIKQAFQKVSWVGFYLFSKDYLYLGPFQGKLACTRIEIGKGVCGLAAKKLQTIVVPDVDKFEGHIVCDSESKSEIVIPIFNKEKFLGVLDLDSTDYNSFNEVDKKYLEELCSYLANNIF
jgi:GAF domain-containing protein